MSLSGKPITDQDLHAYVDNALNLVRRSEVEKFLSKNPMINNELKEYKLFNKAFKHLYDPVLEEKIPQRLLQVDQPQAKRRRIGLAQAASLFIAITTGIVIGWFARDEGYLSNLTHSQTMVMVKDAFSFHAVYTPEVRHPVEVPSKQKAHLAKWLSKRLKTNVRVPNLSAEGFELLGGRLLTTGDEPAAQFMYQNGDGDRVTLFSRHRLRSEETSAFRYASKGSINGFYWTDGELSFVLIADIGKDRVSRLAHIVYEDMNK